MNEVNKTLFIPLYGKSRVSKQGIILSDPTAERIWAAEGFPIRGKSASKWLAYNMAMRARVFDDWTADRLRQRSDALALHIGCGLDSRCLRVGAACRQWIDCDLPQVIAVRRKYYAETADCRMTALDAADTARIVSLPDSPAAIVILEGLSMYLTNAQLLGMLKALGDKYKEIHILMDVYTVFGARASKFKNPVNDVGVTTLYGVDDAGALAAGAGLRVKAEHSMTPDRLVNELKPAERAVFRLLFTGKIYRKIYRLYELES